MKKLVFLIFALSSFTLLFSQHLPLQIGNQWHYDVTGFSSGPNYAAIAVDTISINNKQYIKIERRHFLTGVLLKTTYDRLEGDSSYFRIDNGQEKLLINYNWPNRYTIVTPIDTSCIELNVYFQANWNILNVNTGLYDISFGFWCIGDIDTNWALTTFQITRYFGCYFGNDGWLQGALISGTTYGTLYPLPVELLSFSSSVNDNDITLSWITATETNNSGFQIERRETQNERSDFWENIGFIAGYGTTTEPQTYSYQDENLSAGIYQYRLKQIDFDGTFEYSKTIEVEINPPAKFSLEQNFPNPFNPNTKIKYTIPNVTLSPDKIGKGSRVQLKVFDILGNEVAVLVNEEKPAGNYEIEFNANNLSSCVYFYRLQAGSFVETKKMLILK